MALVGKQRLEKLTINGLPSTSTRRSLGEHLNGLFEVLHTDTTGGGLKLVIYKRQRLIFVQVLQYEVVQSRICFEFGLVHSGGVDECRLRLVRVMRVAAAHEVQPATVNREQVCVHLIAQVGDSLIIDVGDHTREVIETVIVGGVLFGE
jgi:hypothetical protein